MIIDEENPIFVIKPNFIINFLITLLKFSIPAGLFILLLYEFKSLGIIQNEDVFKFFIVAIVFIFTAITLFIFLYEQNRKLKFYESSIEYSDLFESREILKIDIEDFYYKKKLINNFILKKKGTDKEIIIHYVVKDNGFDDFKKKFTKKKTKKENKKEKNKIKRLSLAQLKRKFQIEDIVSGKKTVIIRHPRPKKDYINLKNAGRDFIDLKKLKLRVNEEFPDLSSKKRKDLFNDLKVLKKESDIFKKIKELKNDRTE